MADYDTMRRYLDTIVAGEFEKAAEFFSDDIVVHFSGWRETKGKAEYQTAVMDMLSMVDSMSVEEHDLLVSDDHAIVLNAWHIKKGDRDEKANHVVIYHTDGAGKISEIWVIAEDQAKMAELMS